MNGFERRKEQKKGSILRAALELFRIYGFKKVSINDIAQRAGVSPVTIYNHFGSKDALAKEVVQAQFLDIMKKYREIIDGDGTFPEKMETIVFDKTQTASQFHGELAQMLLQSDPEMRQFIEGIWQGDVTQMTLDLLEEGKRQGYINVERSLEALTLYLRILRDGIAAASDLMADMELKSEFIRELNDIFLYGLVGKPESHHQD